jgi:hypothetical protein
MMRRDGYACSSASKDDSAITDMWMAHFKHLYSSVNDQVTRDLFYERIESL